MIINCKFCNNEFESSHKNNTYCSKKCIKKNSYLKNRQLKSRNKICKNCNKNFIDNSLNNKSLYCEKLCKNKLRYKTNIAKNPDYYLSNNLKFKEYKKLYNQIYNKTYLRDKIKSFISTKEYRKNNIEKYKCHKLLNADKLKNPHLYLEICCICGSTENIDFHHPNYDFPYSVYPLCKKHHKEIHQNIKIKNGTK